MKSLSLEGVLDCGDSVLIGKNDLFEAIHKAGLAGTNVEVQLIAQVSERRSQTEVALGNLSADEGWPGTDVTPGDPPVFQCGEWDILENLTGLDGQQVAIQITEEFAVNEQVLIWPEGSGMVEPRVGILVDRWPNGKGWYWIDTEIGDHPQGKHKVRTEDIYRWKKPSRPYARLARIEALIEELLAKNKGDMRQAMATHGPTRIALERFLSER